MAGGRGIPIRLTLHITGNEEQRPGVSTQHLSTGPGGVRNLKRLVSSHRSHPIVQTDSCWKGQTKIVKNRKREPINIFLSPSSQHKISEKLILPRHVQMLIIYPRHWVWPACDHCESLRVTASVSRQSGAGVRRMTARTLSTPHSAIRANNFKQIGTRISFIVKFPWSLNLPEQTRKPFLTPSAAQEMLMFARFKFV